MRLIFIIVISFLSFSCRYLHHDDKGRLLAKVGGAELYDSDLKIAVAGNADSQAIKHKLVEDWVKNQLVFKKAMATLTEAEKDKDKELKDYYESLMKYAYLEQAATRDADTMITDAEIKNYYDGNQKNFELKRNIIRFLYVKVPVNVLENKRLADWMQHPGKRSMDSLKQFVRLNASNSVLDTGRWYYFSDITNEIPILQDYSPEHFIKNNDYVELQDASYRYYINIVDGRIKEEIAPLPLVKEKIANIIRNQRKLDAEKEIANKIYREAEAAHQFEIYQ